MERDASEFASSFLHALSDMLKCNCVSELVFHY